MSGKESIMNLFGPPMGMGSIRKQNSPIDCRRLGTVVR
jgi:hypothetical protein